MKSKTNKTAQYRKVLLERREQLLQSVRAQRSEMPDSGLQGATGDSSDHAAADYAAEMFGFLLEKQAGDLEQVERALQKIEQGTYGTCECCEKAITEKRLRAIPWARLCRQCQEKQDRSSATRRAAVGRAWSGGNEE